MLLNPSTVWVSSTSSPCARRGAQSSESPTRGAPPIPLMWHSEQLRDHFSIGSLPTGVGVEISWFAICPQPHSTQVSVIVIRSRVVGIQISSNRCWCRIDVGAVQNVDVGAVHNRERFLLETFTIMHGTKCSCWKRSRLCTAPSVRHQGWIGQD